MIIFITTFRLSFSIYSAHSRTAGRPVFVTLEDDFQELIFLRMRSKNAAHKPAARGGSYLGGAELLNIDDLL